ncbi:MULTISPECIES: hypothetical protein [unclassified Streptomyces]
MAQTQISRPSSSAKETRSRRWHVRLPEEFFRFAVPRRRRVRI